MMHYVIIQLKVKPFYKNLQYFKNICSLYKNKKKDRLLPTLNASCTELGCARTWILKQRERCMGKFSTTSFQNVFFLSVSWYIK